MRRLHTTATVLKWGFTALAVLVLLTFLVSRYYMIEFDQMVQVPTMSGPPNWIARRGFHFLNGNVNHMVLDAGMAASGPTRWEAHFFALQLPSWGWHGGSVRMPGGYQEWMPLYIPFVVVVVPAGALWFVDLRAAMRRRARACPSCGYEREGLAAATACPECGSVPSPQ